MTENIFHKILTIFSTVLILGAVITPDLNVAASDFKTQQPLHNSFSRHNLSVPKERNDEGNRDDSDIYIEVREQSILTNYQENGETGGINGMDGMDGTFQLEYQNGAHVSGDSEAQAENGEIEFNVKCPKADVKAGKYKIEEVKEATGFYKQEYPATVTYNPFSNMGEVMFQEFPTYGLNPNILRDEQISVHELDDQNNTHRMNGTFQLEYQNGKSVPGSNAVQAKEGAANINVRDSIFNIANGKYKVVEKKNATGFDKTVQSPPIIMFCNHAWHPAFLTMFKEKLAKPRRNINVHIIASDNHKVKLYGGVQLLNSQSHVIDGLIIHKGSGTFKNEIVGRTYYIWQTGVQRGYRVTRRIRVDLGNKNSSVTFINKHHVKKKLYIWKKVKKHGIRKIKTYVRSHGKLRIKWVRRRVVYYVKKRMPVYNYRWVKRTIIKKVKKYVRVRGKKRLKWFTKRIRTKVKVKNGIKSIYVWE